MFDIFAKLLSSIASFLFPLFASYKALKTSDPAQLTPWLMYWVVLACALLVESWTDWLLVWIPFYAYIRLLFLLYLVLPQTQGARLIYEEYIHPRLEENETAIEEFIASAHERLRTAGITYLKRAIELLRTNVLGLPPSPEAAAPPEPQTPQSYIHALLARFTLPAPRWSTGAATSTAGTTAPSPGTAAGLTADFYSLLASAVSAAASVTATTSSSPTKQPPPPLGAGAAASIIPDSLRSASTAARMSFIQSQRERLRIVLSALDREEAAEASRQRQSQARPEGGNGSGSGGDNNNSSNGGGNGGSHNGVKHHRSQSVGEQSVASGLSKSRSEGDFEKLEAGSGAEDDMDLDVGEQVDSGGVRRRGGGGQEPPAAGGSGGGGWMPWSWGATGGGEAGRSSGVEK